VSAEDRASRTLLLIDERCTSHLHQTVARLSASRITVIAVPRLPALRHYAPLSGHATVREIRADAFAEAQRLARHVAQALPDTCSVDHRVLDAWREVSAVLEHDGFDEAVLAVRPGRRARRRITAAGLASGTPVVCP
jgi:hypothetical protein